MASDDVFELSLLHMSSAKCAVVYARTHDAIEVRCRNRCVACQRAPRLARLADTMPA
jgi:hypothetical protein